MLERPNHTPLLPTSYTTRVPNRFAYAGCACRCCGLDLITTFTVYLDDPIDGHETRGKMPAWYVHYPISFPSDAAS